MWYGLESNSCPPTPKADISVRQQCHLQRSKLYTNNYCYIDEICCSYSTVYLKCKNININHNTKIAFILFIMNKHMKSNICLRIFTFANQCGCLLEQSLMLTRRKDDEELQDRERQAAEAERKFTVNTCLLM